MYYPCSENKGADQLCSYCTTDLRFCFCIGNNPVFSPCGSYYTITYTTHYFSSFLQFNFTHNVFIFNTCFDLMKHITAILVTGS